VTRKTPEIEFLLRTQRVLHDGGSDRLTLPRAVFGSEVAVGLANGIPFVAPANRREDVRRLMAQSEASP
jgi:hypothetical protein